MIRKTETKPKRGKAEIQQVEKLKLLPKIFSYPKLP